MTDTNRVGLFSLTCLEDSLRLPVWQNFTPAVDQTRNVVSRSVRQAKNRGGILTPFHGDNIIDLGIRVKIAYY